MIVPIPGPVPSASPLLAVWAKQLQASGITNEDVEAVFAPIDRRHPARIPADRILLQAGRHDLVALPEGVEELRERWGGPRISWYRHSHTSIFLARHRLIAEAVSFAEEALSCQSEAVERDAVPGV